jgi:pimeloyl-ACP methyl ester carboxylesterase|tara:strand:+ start:751 stop:1389 length:639 start_codon:yes stop_codon:yes gene_type:complete
MLDARNHGRSPHAPIHTYEAMAQDIVEFMDARGIAKASLLGHSMGGKTVLLLSQLHPERMDKLVVADIAPRAYTPHHGPIFDALLATDPASAPSRDAIQSQLSEALDGDPVLVPFLMKGLHRLKEGGFAWRFNVPVLHATIQDVVGHIELGLNTLPTLFIRGSESDYVSDDDLDVLEDHFLHMDHHTIQGVGHWLHAQAPDEFFDVTAGFLA